MLIKESVEYLNLIQGPQTSIDFSRSGRFFGFKTKKEILAKEESKPNLSQTLAKIKDDIRQASLEMSFKSTGSK